MTNEAAVLIVSAFHLSWLAGTSDDAHIDEELQLGPPNPGGGSGGAQARIRHAAPRGTWLHTGPGKRRGRERDSGLRRLGGGSGRAGAGLAWLADAPRPAGVSGGPWRSLARVTAYIRHVSNGGDTIEIVSPVGVMGVGPSVFPRALQRTSTTMWRGVECKKPHVQRPLWPPNPSLPCHVYSVCYFNATSLCRYISLTRFYRTRYQA